ncbi:hypothetical protein CR513_56588, partial [Mucuna pruriens]
MKLDVALKIKEEVEKQWNARFLVVVEYPQWVANIVPMPKKNGKVRICVGYRDLKRASPKDNFLLPYTDVLIDNMAQHAYFSFMDDFSSYNQIKMAPKDRKKTMFITTWETFFYKKYKLRLNLAKCTFDVKSGKLLGFIVNKREIKVDPNKIKAIREISTPKIESEM